MIYVNSSNNPVRSVPSTMEALLELASQNKHTEGYQVALDSPGLSVSLTVRGGTGHTSHKLLLEFAKKAGYTVNLKSDGLVSDEIVLR